GLLPKGLTEDDLSLSDEDDEQAGDVEEKRTEDEKFDSAALRKPSSVVEAQSTHTAGDADSNSPTCSMPGISQEMWQKFQDLRKKNEDMKTMKIPRRRKRRRHKKGSGLEKSIERAVAEGDIAKAEEMSDRLATREVRCADKRSLGCSRCDKSG
ncbi:hypothetical protein INR49_009679, partial [Caranx melampygus]